MGVPFQLLVITDQQPAMLARVEAALAVELAPRVAVLLRDKQANSRQMLDTALALRALTQARGARLIVSDRLAVALLSEADGVHLPEVGFTVHQARSCLGASRLIGVSRHDAHGIVAAQQAGADYATLSPVFATPDKGTPLGMANFAHIARACRLPVFALGGVTTRRVPELIRAGAAGVAVIREVMSATDPGLAVTELLRAVGPTDPH